MIVNWNDLIHFTEVKLVFYTANYTAIVYSLHKFFLYTENAVRSLQVFQTRFLQKFSADNFQTRFLQKFSADNFQTNFMQTKKRLKTSIQNQFEHIPVFHFTFMGFNICSLGNNNVTNSFAWNKMQKKCNWSSTKQNSSSKICIQKICLQSAQVFFVYRKCCGEFTSFSNKVSAEILCRQFSNKVFAEILCRQFSNKLSADEITSRNQSAACINLCIDQGFYLRIGLREKKFFYPNWKKKFKKKLQIVLAFFTADFKAKLNFQFWAFGM